MLGQTGGLATSESILIPGRVGDGATDNQGQRPATILFAGAPRRSARYRPDAQQAATTWITQRCRPMCASWCASTLPTWRVSDQRRAGPGRRGRRRRDSRFVERAASIERELHKAIVGQHDVVRQVMIALFAGGHVLLEGVPGLGKTCSCVPSARHCHCVSVAFSSHRT